MLTTPFSAKKTKVIREREIKSKKLNKYVAAFDYVDKDLLDLSAANIVISINSFDTAVGAPIRKESASISLIFSFCRRS